MKILVLGGTGAMGVPVVDILAERGNDLYVTSRTEKQSSRKNVHYIKGNAKDDTFLQNILEQKFDVIIDFMIYGSDQFKNRMEMLLENVKQYFFFSSSRVYADAGDSFITEESSRLLDAIKDEEYLNTDDYALAKAREENLLRNSGHNNWTIIRPYITYNNERLQLGTLEKESWLQRALEGKKIVFGRDIAAKYTTLTWGYDVSLRIADLVGEKEALGETFHITTNIYIRWSEVCDIYLDTLEEVLGKRPEVFWVENMGDVKPFYKNYQVIYDRLYNRKFDNSKIQRVSHEKREYLRPQEGLKSCLVNFVNGNRNFRGRNWYQEAVFDQLTGDRTNILKIDGWKNKLKYILYRYIKRN